MNPTSDLPPALPAGYPAELERHWQTSDGTTIRLRALHPGDLDRELAFVAGLSPDTLHLRVQYAARGLTRENAARLLEFDYVDNLAIGAFVVTPGGEELVGVSRYARDSGSDEAECAIVVADAWQGHGLGTELMRSIGTAARARGIHKLQGITLGENQRLHDWARRFGYEVQVEPNSGGQVRVTLDLSTLPS